MQPIRGDWRTKVKAARKAVQKEAEAERAPAKEVPHVEQTPDLSEQNKGLPPGWQAIWDPASKGVYYGNINTKVASCPYPKTSAWRLQELIALDCIDSAASCRLQLASLLVLHFKQSCRQS